MYPEVQLVGTGSGKAPQCVQIDPAATVDWRAWLQATGWLAGARPGLADRLLEICLIRQYEEGDVIFREGIASGDLFGVVEGQVAASHFGQGNDDVDLIHIYRPGQWFGYGPIVEGGARRVQVTARRPSRVAVAPEGRLRGLLNDEPGLWELMAWLSDVQGRLMIVSSLDLCRKSQRLRLMATLLRLAGCRIEDGPEGPPYEIAASQLEIAEMSNMSRNVVSRLLQALGKEGLVVLKYRHLHLPDPGAIRRQLRG